MDRSTRHLIEHVVKYVTAKAVDDVLGEVRHVQVEAFEDVGVLLTLYWEHPATKHLWEVGVVISAEQVRISYKFGRLDTYAKGRLGLVRRELRRMRERMAA